MKEFQDWLKKQGVVQREHKLSNDNTTYYFASETAATVIANELGISHSRTDEGLYKVSASPEGKETLKARCQEEKALPKVTIYSANVGGGYKCRVALRSNDEQVKLQVVESLVRLMGEEIRKSLLITKDTVYIRNGEGFDFGSIASDGCLAIKCSNPLGIIQMFTLGGCASVSGGMVVFDKNKLPLAPDGTTNIVTCFKQSVESAESRCGNMLNILAVSNSDYKELFNFLTKHINNVCGTPAVTSSVNTTMVNPDVVKVTSFNDLEAYCIAIVDEDLREKSRPMLLNYLKTSTGPRFAEFVNNTAKELSGAPAK